MSSTARRLILAVLGGGVLFLAFPDVGWWVAAPLAIGMLYVALRDATTRVGFAVGWLFGVTFFLPHVWWAYVTASWLPWIALSTFEALAIGLVGALTARMTRRRTLGRFLWLEPAAFALVWVGAEQLRSVWPLGGFPWARLAFGVVDSPLVRLAWLGGAPLVSLTVALLGAILGVGFFALREQRILQGLAAPAAVVALTLLPIGIPLDGRAQNGEITVAWAQGNLANEGLDSFGRAREVTANHRDATLALAQEYPDAAVDLIIWPESAADIDPRSDAETGAAATEAARAFDAPLLLGTNDYSPAEGRYNTSIVWLPSGKALPGVEYRKQQIVPFGEYIPMRSFVRLFSKEVDRVTTDVIPGEGPTRIDIPIASLDRDVIVGPIICFEVAYDWLSREAVRLGAEFLAVQTNNASYGNSAESTQQLAMSRFRAIETGRSTFQISTVGVSAVISPTGRVLDRAELFTRDAGIVTVPLRTTLTPATQWGGPFALALELLAGVVAVGVLWRGSTRKRGR
ncbi:apolipoprotein N-acyltransferase [Demequina sp. TTPB684]|uniref:apolipoprotein N-acyltransferase n=1 Tax=unclassified Demequina TaxID=2620311 RepID=UPI001CF1DC16|nr:apolipoprotein N-acyltransferase [Demequina sp. TMPB413]MCB2413115.1 apolipoprotein N-acyltransferase [Demequina sp. TTPB684]UPU89277.1 apolipoprotein N-acyltransferase [Demequina sp. TMPB413]